MPEPTSQEPETGTGTSDNEKIPTFTDNSPAQAEQDSVPPTKPRDVGTLAWISIVVALFCSIFLFTLDNTVVADVQASILLDLGEVQKLPWLSVAFPLGAVALCLPGAKINGLFDNKWTFNSGVVIFEVGSAVCGSASTMNAMIVGRVLCGVGGVFFYAAGLNIISVMTTEAERPFYINLAGAAWGIGTVLGPVVGGAFAESSATWRWAFYINLCIGAFFAPVFLFIIPSHVPSPGLSKLARLRQIDWVGTVLQASAMYRGALYSWNSGQVIGLFVCTGVLWILFVLQQAFSVFTTKQTRLFPVKMLKNLQLCILFAEMAASVACVYIPLYYIPIWFQFVQNDGPLDAGIRLLPLICVQVFMVILAGGLANVVGYHAPWCIISGIFSIIGGSLFLTADINTSTASFYGFSVLIAISAIQVQMNQAGSQLLVSRKEIPEAITFSSLGQISGLTLALLLANSIFMNECSRRIGAVLHGYSREAIQGAITGARGQFVSSLDPSQRDLVLRIIVDVIGRLYTLVITGGVVSIGLALFLKRERIYRAAPKTSFDAKKDEEKGIAGAPEPGKSATEGHSSEHELEDEKKSETT